MKYEILLLFIALLTTKTLAAATATEIAAATIDCNAKTSPSKAKDCNNAISDTVKDSNYYCCFIEYKFKEKPSYGDQEGKSCSFFTKEAYDKVKETVDETKDAAEKNGNKLKKYNIKCKSAYLKMGIITLILALLL